MTTFASVPLTEADFQRFSDLLRTRSGMEFSGQRRADLERAIERALSDLQLSAPELLYERLTAGAGAPAALEAFIASLTVPETYFFRNQPQFAALEQRILPELIERRRDVRRLRIWSVGCASGEEPYSLAMLLRRMLPDPTAWDVLILATDLNRSLLEKAQRGVYTAWSFRETPPEVQAQYFTRHGTQFELAPQVRGQVTFAYLNLADDTYPSRLTNTLDMDLILFRNVLIYFGEAMARRVIDRLHGALAAGGWLLVGHAEPSMSLFNQFTTHSFPNAIVYQKRVAPPAPAAPFAAPVEARPLAPVSRRASSHMHAAGAAPHT
ncbi:MAG: chemotaxis protein methyltransferase CheR, partial [Chloroflexota bacterium]|nr:chemotaxis protein methyltransferase CheR [Chloroflexota bacterium]